MGEAGGVGGGFDVEGEAGIEHLGEEDEVAGGDGGAVEERGDSGEVGFAVFPVDVELDEVGVHWDGSREWGVGSGKWQMRGRLARERYTAVVRELVLAIETSNPGGGGNAGSVCVGVLGEGHGVEVLAHHALSPASRHDDALMPAVALVCERAGVGAKDLRRIAVSVGPGGFTSVRIAVTTAKMIGEVTGAACVAVPTALAVAHGVAAGGFVGTLGVLLAWKREDVWRQRFAVGVGGSRVEPLDVGGIVPLGAATSGCDGVTADAELARMLGEVGAEAGRVIAPGFDARWVLEASRGLAAVDPALLLPIYPREPEAVTKWRLLHPPRTGDGDRR